MDQKEQELEDKIAALKEALSLPSTYVYLSVDEITAIEGDMHALEEQLYQYRLKNEEK